MARAYEDAVSALYRGPRETFVAERKRLAAQLKGAGEREAAARLSKLPRPTLAAWVVNQLWWQERSSFDALVARAARLRAGDVHAASAHREAMAKLRALAAAVLEAAAHPAADLTLRRVTTNLAAIAAQGGFAPDPPGALATDRDPPGFESMEASVAAFGAAERWLAGAPAQVDTRTKPAAPRQAGRGEPREKVASNVRQLADAARARTAKLEAREREQRTQQEQLAREERRRAEAEKKRRERELADERRRREQERERAHDERVQLQKERLRIAEQLASATRALELRSAELERRQAELRAAEERLEAARAELAELSSASARIVARLEALERLLGKPSA